MNPCFYEHLFNLLLLFPLKCLITIWLDMICKLLINDLVTDFCVKVSSAVKWIMQTVLCKNFEFGRCMILQILEFPHLPNIEGENKNRKSRWGKRKLEFILKIFWTIFIRLCGFSIGVVQILRNLFFFYNHTHPRKAQFHSWEMTTFFNSVRDLLLYYEKCYVICEQLLIIKIEHGFNDYNNWNLWYFSKGLGNNDFYLFFWNLKHEFGKTFLIIF